MKNPLADGSIGRLHGEMHALVRNPFRDRSMRLSYDAAVRCYDSKHRDLIYAGDRRCVGNGAANSFWRGFDNAVSLNWDRDSKKTAAYAMFRAGRDIRAALDKNEKRCTIDPETGVPSPEYVKREAEFIGKVIASLEK